MSSRILYVVSEFVPVQNAVSVRSRFHVDALVRAGSSVVVLTGRASKGAAGYDMLFSSLAPPSNEAALIARFVREVLFGLSLGLKILRSRHVTHVVITSPPFFMTLICALCARLKRIPYTVDVRDRYPAVLFSLGVLSRNGVPGRVLRLLERWLYRGAARVVTVTAALVQSIEAETGTRHVALVRNGYDPAVFGALVPQPAPNGTTRIVIHGNFGKFFDVETFAGIAQRLAERASRYEIVVIGSGSKLADVRARALKHVTILPEMSQREVASELNGAHVGLSIHTDDDSMRGAFPVKLFEYIGMGLPAVALPESEGGRVVREQGFGECFPTCAWERAADHLVELIQNPALSARYRDAIRSKRTDYGRLAQAQRFAEVVLGLSELDDRIKSSPNRAI